MRRKRYTKRLFSKNIRFIMVGLGLICIVLGLTTFFISNKLDTSNLKDNKTESSKDNSEKNSKDNSETKEQTNDKDLPEKVYKITSLGNLIVHDSQIKGAKTINNSYNFDKSFEYINTNLKNSDLAIGIIEGSFGGGSPSGYPYFNMPDEFLDSCKNSGLDLVTFATNHTIDKGASGFNRSLDKIKEKNLIPIGVRKDSSTPNYTVYEIDGHKIGFFAYTYKTDANGGESINGISIPSSIKNLINTFSYNRLDKFNSEVNSIIKSMKSEDVEFIFSSIHWGEEYKTTENNSQREMAKILSENGVDVILGGHPHVIQPYETIKNSNGKDTLVFYSQGNSLSNQCYEELRNALTEDGLMLEFNLSVKDNKLYLKSYTVIPTWVYREKNSNGTLTHRIIPVEKALKDPKAFNLTNESVTRINRSLNDTEKILGKGKIGSQQFN